MNKIQRSGQLLKTALAVLLREKKLLLFPLAASALVMIVALFFIAPIAFYPTGHSILTAEHWKALGQHLAQWFNLDAAHRPAVHSRTDAFTTDPSGYTRLFTGHPVMAAIGALLYFVSIFLATFCNVAFYHEIMRALNGDTVSIRRGYRFARERWRAILLWSLFAGLVGYLIQTIQERLGLIGRLVTGLIGFVWSTACIFVIPTLVSDKETVNPVKLLRNSVGTLHNTWGELVIGFVGLELAFTTTFMLILLLVVVLPGLFVFYLGLHFSWSPVWIIIGGMGVMMLLIIPFTWVSSIVNSIYRCALYIYATEGVVPGSFDKELLDSAWKVK